MQIVAISEKVHVEETYLYLKKPIFLSKAMRCLAAVKWNIRKHGRNP